MICSSCGKDMGNTRFCPFCGTEHPTASTNMCLACSASIPSGASFCPDCGTDVHTEPDPRADVFTAVKKPYHQPQPGLIYDHVNRGTFPRMDGIQPGSLWRRFFAALIDLIFMYLIMLLTTKLVGGQAVMDSNNLSTHFSVEGSWSFAVILAPLVYFTAMEGLLGATLGKLAAGIKVVMEDGTPVTWQASIIRNLLRIIDMIPWFLPYILGAIFVWISPERQRLGDRAGKTLVVNSR